MPYKNICGITYCPTPASPVVLEFHHLHNKDIAIAEMVTRVTNIARLEEELKKHKFYVRIATGKSQQRKEAGLEANGETE